MNDLLVRAAEAWKSLLSVQYHFTYGKNGKLLTVTLGFEPDEFYHVAGFAHLSDIVFPFRFSHTKVIDVILSGKVKLELLKKSEYYEEMVRPRLEAIVRLQDLLDSDFVTYTYNQEVVPFYSRIEAKYLISNISGDVVFAFTDQNAESGVYYTRSAFMMGTRDFRKNQKKIKLLKKEKAVISADKKE